MKRTLLSVVLLIGVGLECLVNGAPILVAAGILSIAGGVYQSTKLRKI